MSLWRWERLERGAKTDESGGFPVVAAEAGQPSADLQANERSDKPSTILRSKRDIILDTENSPYT
jgi:hypothetical protein